MNTVVKILCAVVPLFCNYLSSVNGEPEGKTWVVCVAGLDYYAISYSFESGIYRICGQIGGPGFEQKIIISPDTVAYNEKNVVAGHMIHDQSRPDELPNYHEDVEITYNAKNMTQEMFFNILSGKKTKGLHKVVESGPKDTLILVIITIGDQGIITLNNEEFLEAELLIPFLESLSESYKFKKCFLYLDSPASGAMFDNYLDTDKNIIVWTSGAKQDYFELCGKSYILKAFTSTCHTLFFFDLLEVVHEMGQYNEITLSDFYQKVVENLSYCMPSIPMLFGQLDLANLRMKDFFGELVLKKAAIKKEKEPDENKNEDIEIKIANSAPKYFQIKGLKDYKKLIGDESIFNQPQPSVKLES